MRPAPASSRRLLSLFSPIVLMTGVCLADEGRIRQTVESLAGVGSRVAGYPGAAAAAEYIATSLRAAGVESVWREDFPVTVPVDRGGGLLVDGESQGVPMHSLWPNLVRTSTLPQAGLHAPLVYGGRGSFSELTGLPLEGRVVLLEFDSWDNWLRLASLGCRAVVFIAPEEATWHEANAKQSQAPLDVPRFWVDAAAGARLRERLRHGEVQAHLSARMDWERRPAWNILGIVPGRDPRLRDETVVVQAYYDGTSVVPALAPSAETAASAAALVELAHHLHRQPPARTVVLAATSAHFQGRQGITHLLRPTEGADTTSVLGGRSAKDIRLFVGIDLSSGSDRLGLWNNTEVFGLKRLFVPLGRHFARYAEAEATALGRDPAFALANGITAFQGMDWKSYVPGGIRTDGEIALEAGLLSLSFVTVHDARLRVDTPLDRPEAVSVPNLARQSELLNGILSRAFDDTGLLSDTPRTDRVLHDRLRLLNVQVRLFGRRGQAPDRPLPGALVVLNTRGKPHRGVRETRYDLADDRGDRLLAAVGEGALTLAAYGLDDEGRITHAPDLGQQGLEYSGEATGSGASADVRWQVNERSVVVFPAVGRAVYDLVDPHTLEPLTELRVLDRTGASPKQFGVAFGEPEEEPVAVVFGSSQEDVRQEPMKLLASSGLLGYRMLLINAPGGGDGYRVCCDTLTHTALRAARDMWHLDEGRLREMRLQGIENPRVAQLHEAARVLIEDADASLALHDWERYAATARGALGLESRAYPDVVGTRNDVVMGLVFYLALVIPAAFFGERLLIGSRDIRWQLAGFGALMLVIWLLVSQVHPAFALAHPVIILLSFAILGMAAFVAAMVMVRLNGYVRDHHGRRARVQDTDISRVSASLTAFMLGISNMRRRRLRTGLTLVTITLLTFTVLTFTTFQQRIQFMRIDLDRDAEYPGILVRDPAWEALPLALLDYVDSHFSGRGLLAPRSWYLPGESQAAPALGAPSKSYVDVAHGARSVRSHAILGLSAAEAQVTSVAAALIAGGWFADDDEMACILPSTMARDLEIGAADIGQARVRIFGEELVVKGILDAERLQRIRDLDDEPLTPLDAQMQLGQGLARQARRPAPGERKGIPESRSSWHLQAANVVVVPHRSLQKMGGDLRSVAIRFDGSDGSQELIESLLVRVGITLYAGLPRESEEGIGVVSYTSIGVTAVRGLSALAVPIGVAALIVLNTMLGSVYERTREIGTYSAIGLAPGHIAMLFMAEAVVYAVLGVTLGYLLSQGLGRALASLDLLGGIPVNTSSMSAVLCSLLVMAVVVVSTIYPARMASQAAVPEVMRRWRPPPPEGDRWAFAFPFMVGESQVLGLTGFLFNLFEGHRDESVGQLYVRHVEVVSESTDQGPEYGVRLLVWLAPFDMGVSQYAQMEFTPSGTPGIYAMHLFVQRLSGQQAFWQRLNHGFVGRLRKEMLVWHTLKEEARAHHRDTATGQLSGGEAA